MNKVLQPNLPKINVKTTIISGEYDKFVSGLEALKINVIKTSAVKELPLPVRNHADMQCLHLGENKVSVLRECANLRLELEKLGFEIILPQNQVSGSYPKDVAINCAIVSENVFLNKNTIDSNIVSHLKKLKYKIIEVKQGYTKCSTAVIAENAIITADEGIYSAALKNKIDALKISAGHIELPGYSYGFIGGCCGYISKDILAFTGKIESHPDYRNIKAFMQNYKKHCLSLANTGLVDVGGILPILED